MSEQANESQMASKNIAMPPIEDEVISEIKDTTTTIENNHEEKNALPPIQLSDNQSSTNSNTTIINVAQALVDENDKNESESATLEDNSSAVPIQLTDDANVMGSNADESSQVPMRTDSDNTFGFESIPSTPQETERPTVDQNQVSMEIQEVDEEQHALETTAAATIAKLQAELEDYRKKYRTVMLEKDKIALNNRATTGAVLNSAFPLADALKIDFVGLVENQALLEEVVENRVKPAHCVQFLQHLYKASQHIIEEKFTQIQIAVGYAGKKFEDLPPNIRRLVSRLLQDSFYEWSGKLEQSKKCKKVIKKARGLIKKNKPLAADTAPYLAFFCACRLSDPQIILDTEQPESISLEQIQRSQYLDTVPNQSTQSSQVQLVVPALKRNGAILAPARYHIIEPK